jgi:uncharacterized membrane protein (DUF485 family)
MRGIFPALGALMLAGAFGFSVVAMFDPDYGNTVLFGIGGVFVVGVGALALGAVLMGVWALRPNSRPFFRGETLNETTEVLVPEDEQPVVRSIDGGR